MASQRVIWSGNGGAAVNVRLFTDAFNTYVLGLHRGPNDLIARRMTRIAIPTLSGVTGTYWADPLYSGSDVSPDTDSNRIIASHYIDEFFNPYNTVALESVSGYTDMYYTYYPESQLTWTTTSGINATPVDVVFPEYLPLPRFLIGISGGDARKVMIIIASGGLDNRYPTNWTAMPSGARVTDLEVVRII